MTHFGREDHIYFKKPKEATHLTFHAGVGSRHVDVETHVAGKAHCAVVLSVVGLVRSDRAALRKLRPLHAEVTWGTHEAFAGVGRRGGGAATCADVAGHRNKRSQVFFTVVVQLQTSMLAP